MILKKKTNKEGGKCTINSFLKKSQVRIPVATDLSRKSR